MGGGDTDLKDRSTDGSCFVDVERLGDALENWKMNICQISARCWWKLLVAPVVLLRLLQYLCQSLRHPGFLAFESRVFSIEGGVSSEAFSFHQVDLNRHHVGKVLSICGCHIQNPPTKKMFILSLGNINSLEHGKPGQVAFCAQHSACLIKVEAGVGIPSDNAVADHVAGIEVQSREGEDLASERHRPGNLVHASHSFKLQRREMIRRYFFTVFVIALYGVENGPNLFPMLSDPTASQ